MTVRLNHGAEAHAHALIDAGDYDDGSPWSFDAADGDQLLGNTGDNWANYRKWFLGEDDGPTNEKGTYHYPVGKNGKVYGQALRAIRSRASQQGASEIFDAAGRLLDHTKGGDKSNRAADAYYSMKAAGATGEILLYQDIGQGGFFSEGTSAEGFARDLKALGKISTLNVRINSPGGQVFEGLTIYNLLASHNARKIVHIDGLAASIASVVAMAGDEINIADNGMMMIHDAWGVGIGTADEIRKTADVLDTITATIAGTYAKRSGGELDTVRKMMASEKWMSAAEAAALGFADHVVDNMQAMNCAIDLKRYRNVPRHVIERQTAMPAKQRFDARFRQLQQDRIRERSRAA